MIYFYDSSENETVMPPEVIVRHQLYPTRRDTVDCETFTVLTSSSGSPQSGSCHHSVFLFPNFESRKLTNYNIVQSSYIKLAFHPVRIVGLPGTQVCYN